MKTVKMCAALAALLFSFSAYAAGINNNVNSEANTNSEAMSSAQNAGNAQNINFNSDAPSDTQTLKNTPGVILGGFSGSFSSDYCGATAQGGLGLPGFSLAAGGPVIDEKCVQLRTFERTMQAAGTVAPSNPQLASRLQQAAIDMLCLVSLSAQGLCSGVNITNADHRAQPVRNEARTASNANQPIVVSERYTGSDPIVMRRLGLTPQ